MNETEKTREAALKLLDRQDRTASELKEKLLKKDFPEASVTRVITDLTASGILDDRRYAELYTRSKLGAGKGRNWIKQKLRLKGIASDIIDEVLEEVKDTEDERLLCLERALKICGLSEQFTVEDYEYVPTPRYDFSDDAGSYPEESCGGAYAEPESRGGTAAEPDRVSYFSRKLDPEETDYTVIRRETDKAKASLTRKLITAGYPSGYVYEAVRKIDSL